ncbi:MAG TPA: DUF4087 domain-containing protein [Blastocatellia bacterium]|nr:DUF4087 domain-containing protein [Blastocatellia bacterium]
MITRLIAKSIACLLLTAASVVSSQRGSTDASAANEFETRCGWFSNPTPGNIWLYDRDGEWTIGVQGGHQTEGDWDWPAFKPGQWVKTNAGSHGYGCVCMKVRVNRETHEVLEIRSARALPLTTCRKDRSLKKWDVEKLK